MRYALQFGGLLLACSAALAADQRSGAANMPAPPPASVRAAPKQPMPKGAPKQPKIGPPLANPMGPVPRLYRATPEERDRALEKLPEKMQEQIRKQLEAFDKLPKEEQEVRIHQAERFAALAPARKAVIRAQMTAWQKLPQDRRAAVGIELRRLFVMPEADRQKLLAGDDFKTRFSPDEQKIIVDLSDVFLPPM